MGEIRVDLLTNKKVVIVPKRFNKPCDFNKKTICPFCQKEGSKFDRDVLLEIKKDDKWMIRVIKNKYPVVENTNDFIKDDKVWSNYGLHEIVIETKLHDEEYFQMKREQFKQIYIAYIKRYKELSKYENIEYISIFKNHGQNAGASLKHPHSHIVALPFIPNIITEELKCSEKYYRENKKCVFCDIIDEVISNKTLKLVENDSFIIYVPFSGIQPYEFIIIPKVHQSNINRMSELEINDLSEMLEWIFRRINKILGDVDFNIMVHSGPISQENIENYHWHLKITVRLSYLAGQETDAIIRMRTTYPECIAEQFRSIEI